VKNKIKHRKKNKIGKSHIIILNCNSEHLFNLKFAAKDLERNAKKSEKSEREEKNKLKKVINVYCI
jgi:hypothetical protein